MRRLLVASLLVALPVWADSPKPDGKPEKGQPPDDPVLQLKQELDELKRKQAELAERIEDTTAKLKAAEERADGSIRITVTGVLGKEPYPHVLVKTVGKERVQVRILGTGKQLEPLADLVGKVVVVSGDFLLNPAEEWLIPTGSGKPLVAIPGQFGVKNFTIAELPADQPKGKGGEK